MTVPLWWWWNHALAPYSCSKRCTRIKLTSKHVILPFWRWQRALTQQYAEGHIGLQRIVACTVHDVLRSRKCTCTGFHKWHTATCCVGSVANADRVSFLTCKKRAVCDQHSVSQSAVLNLCASSDAFACESVMWTFSIESLQVDGVYMLAVLCNIGEEQYSIRFCGNSLLCAFFYVS